MISFERRDGEKRRGEMETKERSIITHHVFIDIINGDNNDFLNLLPPPVRFF